MIMIPPWKSKSKEENVEWIALVASEDILACPLLLSHLSSFTIDKRRRVGSNTLGIF
jgi:hypothetical protein